MPEEIKKHIENLIDYLYDDEKRHFEESDKPRKHIFRDVQKVKTWLKNQ